MDIEKETISLNIRWGINNLEVKLYSEETLLELQAIIYSVTNVLPEKQKVMFQGKLLKDLDKKVKEYGIANKSTILLMGQPETIENSLLKIDQRPKEVFIEDLTNEEKAKYLKNVLKEVLPVGLENLGNTCYLNSTIQILYRIPEFQESILNFKKSGNNLGENFISSLASLFKLMESKGESFAPHHFVQSFLKTFPQFKEYDPESKAYKQQDADEVFQLILGLLEPLLIQKSINSKNLIEKLFEIKLVSKFVNNELPEEIEEDKFETSRKLSCIIDNQMNPINNLMEGIKLSLNEALEKFSEGLQRNSQFSKKSFLMNLPDYLIVQKIRFIWREKDIYTNTEARKAKILRNVAFPKILDLFDILTSDLKAKVKPVRDRELEISELKKKKSDTDFDDYKKKFFKEGEDNHKLYIQYKLESRRKEDEDHDKVLWSDDKEGEATGCYELVGIITHKGRNSESGHYVAWVQNKGENWLKFDDDEVKKITIEEILNLRGGGDWHMAYYLIYRKLRFCS